MNFYGKLSNFRLKNYRSVVVSRIGTFFWTEVIKEEWPERLLYMHLGQKAEGELSELYHVLIMDRFS